MNEDIPVLQPADFDCVSVLDAAHELKIHPATMSKIVQDGRIPHHRLAGKILIERSVLDSFKAAYNPRPGRKDWNAGRLAL